MKKLIYKSEKLFDATAPKQIEKVWIEWGYDDMTDAKDFPDAEYPSDQQFYFCRAVAEVSYSIGRGSRRLQCLESSGLHGIDTDEGDYADEVEDDQLAELAEHLEVLCGITGMPLDAYKSNVQQQK